MRRCEGVVIKEVRGQNKNVRCPEKSTATRRLVPTKGKPKSFHYCEKCVKFWDRQQALIGSMLSDG
jgi:hypothetical protein